MFNFQFYIINLMKKANNLWMLMFVITCSLWLLMFIITCSLKSSKKNQPKNIDKQTKILLATSLFGAWRKEALLLEELE